MHKQILYVMKQKFIIMMILSCLFLSGCSHLNPFVPKYNNEESETDNKPDEYMKSVEESLEKKNELENDYATNFAKNFQKKTEDIYFNAMENLTKPSNKDDGESLPTSLLKSFYATYYKIRLASPFIIIGSIIFGSLGALFSRLNKGAKRFFIVAFVILIPLLTLLIVYGIGILNGIFLN